ncbi:MAG TPA: hypothetical protein P5230_02480 [Candidatus Magasanikbacteria bacterium]|nr:hypothetical protein [Candidatus Magasanikbacteria bacterium]
MSESRRWQGGDRVIKPRVEEETISDPEDPFYIPTPAEFEEKKKKEEDEKNKKKEIKSSNA